ncbi:exodeoxyribonuclease VII small subunit [Halosquirtibacter xylanolyticus]|uniref:exodeoxyribonuclease VII small subunit n=1 Tax=Halosquirtibacter xylanolyticus TaxID=3374599 RepID=UPI003747CD75|nr:exodeoxyribonuclease VII small subunit [Prolixibacteraceae bacterium]
MVDNKSYKESIEEIKSILEKIENDEYDVDVLVEKVKYVSNLIKHCKSKLKQSETEIDNILSSIEME